MSGDKSEEAKKVSRRNLLKGLGVTVLVGAVVVIGVDEGMNILALPKETSSTTATTSLSTTAAKTPVYVGLTARPAYNYAGESVLLTATPSGGTPPCTISIDCGDGTTLTASGSHTYMLAGIYTVLVTVTDSKGIEASATTQVIIQSPPAP